MLAKIVAAIVMLLLTWLSPAAGLNPDFSEMPALHRILNDQDFTPPAEPFAGDLRELAGEVHARYLRGFSYVPSQTQYGAGNYWPTRGETLHSRKADCKGFAVAAYYDLLEAGVPEEMLYIWVVVLKKTGEVHAVAIAGEYVIDRMVTRVITLEEARGVYTSIYRFNRRGWTVGEP